MTGIGAVTPLGLDAPSTWRAAVAGESGIDWIGAFENAPRKIFLTHGEETAAESLAAAIQSATNWTAEIPAYGDVVDLN